MLTDETALLRQIIREEMKSVLKEIGLHDDDAGNDVRDLRSLITDWRGCKYLYDGAWTLNPKWVDPSVVNE